DDGGPRARGRRRGRPRSRPLSDRLPWLVQPHARAARRRPARVVGLRRSDPRRPGPLRRGPDQPGLSRAELPARRRHPRARAGPDGRTGATMSRGSAAASPVLAQTGPTGVRVVRAMARVRDPGASSGRFLGAVLLVALVALLLQGATVPHTHAGVSP